MNQQRQSFPRTESAEVVSTAKRVSQIPGLVMSFLDDLTNPLHERYCITLAPAPGAAYLQSEKPRMVFCVANWHVNIPANGSRKK
ncbi:hypothetical protein LDC_1398 [sediment metagenome]|uniref:Uncharacterized protein n=1 Tax=sediment metagenome TaxID=749907 RepID=D9PIP0_9ZZZZ